MTSRSSNRKHVTCWCNTFEQLGTNIVRNMTPIIMAGKLSSVTAVQQLQCVTCSKKFHYDCYCGEKDSVHGWKCFLCDLNPRSAASSSSPERSEYTSELGNKDGCIGLDASQACGERCQQMENAPYTECGKSRVDTCLRRLGGSYRAKAKYKMERNRKTVAKHISTVFGPSSDGKGHGLKIRISRLLLKPKQVISTFDVEPVELGSGRKFPIRVVPYLSEQSTSNTISTRLRVSPSDLQNKNLNTVWEDFGPGILLLTCDDGCNPHLTFRIPPHNIVHISLRSNPEAVPVVKFQFPNLIVAVPVEGSAWKKYAFTFDADSETAALKNLLAVLRRIWHCEDRLTSLVRAREKLSVNPAIQERENLHVYMKMIRDKPEFREYCQAISKLAARSNSDEFII